MSTNALASLQALANKQYKPRVQAPKPHDNNGFNNPPNLPSPNLPEPRIESVDINTDTNEVAIEIVGRLTKAVEDQLFSKGFKWQIASRIWIGDYNNETIKYLNVVWNQSIDLLEEEIQVIAVPDREEKTVHRLTGDIELIVVPDRDESMLDRYRRQVDELCESLKIDRADLLLLAIDHLYNSKLSN